MEGEIKNFIKVWISVLLSLSYCYFIASKIPKGKIRLLSILPIISLFLYLPLNLTSIHLGGLTSFFISWLSNFKLLLFSFGQGPLASDPSISLLSFISLACLPIKIQQSKQNPSPQINKEGQKSPLNYAIKSLLLALLIRVYDYRHYMHPKIVMLLYCFHIYFALEVILAMFAFLARHVLGFELEPQFNDPYLSTSLQDFWGKRWNLMVTSILRPTVYEPIRSISTRIFGRRYASVPAIFGTFVVSGAMHELIFYYLGRVEPTWEISCFFVLHGVCLVVEIAVKKAVKGRWRLHPVITGPLTIVFVLATGFWLFFPQLLRCGTDVRAFREYAAVGEFALDIAGVLRLRSFNVSSA